MKTEKETPAGEYTGAFSLSLDGQKYDVPVTVTVWDFTVPDEVHARNSFYLFQDELSNGQWDNTKESYQKYVDYFLDYRISTTEIASLDYNTEDWVEQVKKYAADPRVTSYNVHGDGHYGMTLLKALIENSTPELNLLDKAFFYLFDEPYTMLEQASETYYRKIDELIALADSYTRRRARGIRAHEGGYRGRGGDDHAHSQYQHDRGAAHLLCAGERLRHAVHARQV